MKHLLPLIILIFTFTAYVSANGSDAVVDNERFLSTSLVDGSYSVSFASSASSAKVGTEETGIGTIPIGDETFAVSQSDICTVSVPSATRVFSAAGGTSDFAVTAANGCAWTATTNVSWITINIGTGTGSGRVYFTVSQGNPTGMSRSGAIIVNGQSTIVEQGDLPRPPTAFDFDSDGRSDFSIYRPAVGEWWYMRSSDGGNRAFQFGSSTDKIVPADYNGDGKTDIAFYRPSSGEWFILRNDDFSYYSFPFGLAEDIPIPADYDGDGKVDPAVYRPSTSVWYILKSTGGVTIKQFGVSGDVPIPADYNGDGKADYALFNDSPNIKPVVADYTGDGKADAATYNVLTGEWRVHRSEDRSTYTIQFGMLEDIPVPADYDGDGKTDFAIYRPSTSTWWYAASSAGGQSRAVQFGNSTDKPVPSAYVR